jgi:fluoride ion exporter CrcB/FEX
MVSLKAPSLKMGTIFDWVLVLLCGGLWAGLTTWWFRLPTEGSQKQERTRADIILAVLGGLLFGLMTTFHWERAVHKPLVFLTGPVFAGLLILGYLLRKKRISTRISR